MFKILALHIGNKTYPYSSKLAKMKKITTVPLNFVVNTVLYQYCVYYEIYWNRRYFHSLEVSKIPRENMDE